MSELQDDLEASYRIARWEKHGKDFSLRMFSETASAVAMFSIVVAFWLYTIALLVDFYLLYNQFSIPWLTLGTMGAVWIAAGIMQVGAVDLFLAWRRRKYFRELATL